MSLEDYEKKRDFLRTPEPRGKPGPGSGLRFVVHKHAASHLHYDLRLELDGVLKSWAVPKGPSLDPSIKRLAMMVEDHPLQYGNFEGVIPAGNYGAGRVIIWDAGLFQALGTENREENEKILMEGLRKGDLKFILHGRKLRGAFALVRLRSDQDNTWLLIKKKDEFATSEDITADGRSVASGITIEDLPMPAAPKRRDVPRIPQRSDEAPPVPEESPLHPMPHLMPMLATLVDEPFDDPEWLFEIKHDGYRAIAEIRQTGDVLLYSRNDLAFNRSFPTLIPSLRLLKREAVLDGEIVILDEAGRSDFQLLQNYGRTGEGRIVYQVFDLLYLDGRELKELPLLERKELLRSILPEDDLIRYSDHIAELGISFFQLARENRLEGIIAKRADSRYYPGRRSRDWLKMKVKHRQEAVICGFTEPRGSRKKFGALILGAYDRGKLVYIGHSGGGFDERTLKEVYEILLPLSQGRSPFSETIRANMPVTWVRPEVVCEVEFSEWTDEGAMRHPVFIGLRQDKAAGEVVREVAEEPVPHVVHRAELPLSGDRDVVVEGRRLRLTNLDKVFWPEEKITKGDVIGYYREVAQVILPHLRDRPESLYRTPHGIAGDGFFQKDVRELPPEWVRTEEIYSESNQKSINYLLCQDEATLVYMANLGCIEINPWLSRLPSLDYPDYCVIDLDPEDISFERVVAAARAVKEVLDLVGARGFPKTSGATGIHIYIPLAAKYPYEASTRFAQLIATLANARVPEFTSLVRSPSKRQKKVYLDYLQNRRGQTLAAPYSIRPRQGATVSTPLLWEEVDGRLDPRDFTIMTVRGRIAEKGDLFAGVLDEGVDIEKCLEKLEREVG